MLLVNIGRWFFAMWYGTSLQHEPITNMMLCERNDKLTRCLSFAQDRISGEKIRNGVAFTDNTYTAMAQIWKLCSEKEYQNVNTKPWRSQTLHPLPNTLALILQTNIRIIPPHLTLLLALKTMMEGQYCFLKSRALQKGEDECDTKHVALTAADDNSDPYKQLADLRVSNNSLTKSVILVDP